MSGWWNDFSKNLATDLAPLISLLGEAPTKQYLSECLTPTDMVIFAMAPLGILTAVVSVIRVCGTPSLRAFIGRAQEGGGNAEAELCSSTSRDVCELYNNGGIARVFGRPKLLEIVHDAEASNESFYQSAQGAATAGIYPFKDYIRTPRGQQEWEERPAEVMFTIRRRKRSLKSTENGNASSPSTRFAPNPNLSLNVGIKSRSEAWFIIAAVLGFTLQTAVLAWAALARYAFRLIRGGSRDVYAVSMTVVGTVFLCSGMTLCAFLVERSTKERLFERKLDSKPESRMYWIQPGNQVIGDQVFDSFAYTDRENASIKYTTSWKESEPPHVAWVWGAVVSTMVGFVLQFLGLRACHSSVSVAQLGAMLVMSVVRAALRTERLRKEDNIMADHPDFYQGHELDWLALELGNKCKWQVFSSEIYHPEQSSEGGAT
ncbi:hypothetical protein GP486_007482, partial [Trichoglossum hirsutum]